MAGEKKPPKTAAPPEDEVILRLDGLVGNPRVRGLIERALTDKSLFPSLLFAGPSGIGKLTTARAIAASLNCLSPEGVQACGTCGPCRKIASGIHPDVKVLESEASARDAGRPLYFPTSTPEGGNASPSRTGNRLLIAQVRNLVRETCFRPFEGRRRVLILRDLETDPGQGCANVLLKTLEEPPTDTVFIVVTAQPERLPVTVHSRCHVLPFVAAPLAAVVAFLERRGIETAEAHWRAAWTNGCPGAALRLDAEARLRSRDALLVALAAAVEGGPAAASVVAEPFSRRGVELLPSLDDLTLVVRDLMIWDDDPDRNLLTNRDKIAEMEHLAARIPPRRAARLLAHIAWCASATERNVSPSLMWQTLFLEAGGHLADAPLTDPWLPELPGREHPR